MTIDNQTTSPSFINKKRSECSDDEFLKRRAANRKRGYEVAQLARQSKSLSNGLTDFLVSKQGQNLPEETMIMIVNLRHALGQCANHTLMRQYPSNGAVEYIASHTCKHKLCPVCNKGRQRAIRNKYYHFFKDGEFHLPSYEKAPEMQTLIGPEGPYEVQKKDREGKLKFTRKVVGHKTHYTKDFDFMHLTLTVPHSAEGWRGKRFYARELMKEFNYMRKKSFWKHQVFGGEFGCEVTKGENGLHVHIHALLIVHKESQSRNKLYREILAAWNRQTVDHSTRKFTKETKEGICKSLGAKSGKVEHLGERAKEIFEGLNPKGSTMISLENLFILSKTKQAPNDIWLPEKQRWKHYVDTKDSKQFLAGILETIKYHFEPIALNKKAVKKLKRKGIQEIIKKQATERVYSYEAYKYFEDQDYEGIYNLELIAEILPEIYGKPLMRKFGCLHGVEFLNVNSKIEDELNQMADMNAREKAINPETGKEESECRYIVVNGAAMYYDEERDLRPKIPPTAKVRYLESSGLKAALKEMIEIKVRKNSREKQNSLNVKRKKHEVQKGFEKCEAITPNYNF